MSYMYLPNFEESIKSFIDNLVYVISLNFLYDFVFKEWTTKDYTFK